MSFEARYLAATPRSRELSGRALDVLPSGGNNTGTASPRRHDVYATRATGCYVYDVDGREILDLVGGMISLVGHDHPSVIAAVHDQVDRGLHLGMTSDRTVEMAELVKERIPSMERIRFTSSGTEAVMFAVRLARGFTGRSKILRMEGSYHGQADMMCLGHGHVPGLRSWDPAPGSPPRKPVGWGVLPAEADGIEFGVFNDLDRCAAALERHRNQYAGVIVEPVLGTGGNIPAEPGFLEGLRELCDRHGALLIFDEMISVGIAPGGAQGHYGVRPDLTAAGKSVVGGMPVGLFGGRADVMGLLELADDGRVRVTQGGTFAGHSIIMAAGIANLRALTPEVYSRAGELGEYMRAGVRAVADRAGVDVQVTGVQHLVGIHYTDAPVRTYADVLSADQQLLGEIGLSLLSQGVLIYAASASASAAMAERDVDRFLAALSVAFEETGAAKRCRSRHSQDLAARGGV